MKTSFHPFFCFLEKQGLVVINAGDSGIKNNPLILPSTSLTQMYARICHTVQ